MNSLNHTAGRGVVSWRLFDFLSVTVVAGCLLGQSVRAQQTFTIGPDETDISQLKGNETDPAIAINSLNPSQLFVSASTDANVGLFTAWSANSGVAWTSNLIATGSDELVPAGGESSVAWDAYGNLFVAYQPSTAEGVAIAMSTNGGANFTMVTNLASFDATDLPKITSPAKGAGAGSVWVVYKDYTITGAPLVAQGMQNTGLGGVTTFGPQLTIPDSGGGDFADISVGPAGQVMVAFQDNITNSGQAHILTSINTNAALGGGAFGPVSFAASDAVGGFTYITAQSTGIGINATPGLAWDNDSFSHYYGHAYLVYTGRASANGVCEIDLRVSTNNGATWSSESRINDDHGSNDHFFPRIAIDPATGLVAASWYDCRNDLGTASQQISELSNMKFSVPAGIMVTNVSVMNNDMNVTYNLTNDNNGNYTISVIGSNLVFGITNLSSFKTLSASNTSVTVAFDGGAFSVTIGGDTNSPAAATLTIIETNVFPEAFTRDTVNGAPIPYTAASFNGGGTFTANSSLIPATVLINAPAQGFVSSISGSTSVTGFGHYTGLAFFDGSFFPVWADNSDITGNNPDKANKNFDIAMNSVVIPTSDVSVSVTNSPNPVLSAGVLTYQIVAENNGPSKSGAISITNTIAPGLTFQTAIPALGGTYVLDGQMVIFSLPALAKGASETSILRVTATSSSYATNVTVIGSPVTDPVPTNNIFVLPTLIAGEALGLGMTESESNSLVGDMITYTINVTNIGPSMNGDVIVSNLLSANLQPISYGLTQGTFTNYNNTLVFNLGTLGTNQSASLLVNAVTLAAGQTASSFAVVSSEDLNTNAINSSATVTAQVAGEDLALGMTSTPGTQETGMPITYSISVTNFGPSTNEQVIVSNQFSTNLSQFALAQAPNGTEYLITNNQVVLDLGPLGVNQSVSLSLTAIPTSAGFSTNIAVVGNPFFDTNFFNNRAASATIVTQAPPMIYNLQMTSAAGSALIAWRTVFPGTSQVAYGLTPAYGSITSFNPTPTNFHVALLGGLIPGSNYYFQALSQVSGVPYSSNGTFSTVASLILNTPDASYTGLWTASSQDPGIYGSYYQYAATTSGNPTASATYRPNISASGTYDVAIWYPQDPSFSTNAQIFITGGTNEIFVPVNQSANGGGWVTLATNFYLAEGLSNTVVIYNNTGEANRSVVANAVRWTYNAGQDLATNGALPAWWANFFFGTNVSATADSDGDGYSNYAEYVFGTDPNDSSSYLNFSVTPGASNTVSVVFSPWVGGRVYQLQSTADLTNPSWTTLTNTATENGLGDGVFVVPQTSGSSSFYRLNAHF